MLFDILQTITDDQHRRRYGGQTPGVAVGGGQLGAGDLKSSAHAAGANDDLFTLQPQPALCFDSVRIGEAGVAGSLVIYPLCFKVGEPAQGS
jgi:hypothetical protein